MCLAIPGCILSIDDTEDTALLRPARVDFGGIVKEVSLIYVPEAQVGDYVIVHVGFALSLLDQKEALKTLQYFEEIGELTDDHQNDDQGDNQDDDQDDNQGAHGDDLKASTAHGPAVKGEIATNKGASD